MKRLAIFVAVVLVLIVTVLAGCEFLCKLGVKCEHCEMVSESRAASIHNGYFVGTWVPVKRNFFLKYHKVSVRLDTAWGEHAWFYDTKTCLLAKKKMAKDFNLVLPFTKSDPDSFLFLFTLEHFEKGAADEHNGGIGMHQKDLRLFRLEDTIDYLIFEKDPDTSVGWAKGGIIVDTVRLIKTNN